MSDDAARSILLERARLLARPTVREEDREEIAQLVVLPVGRDRYAVRAEHVRTVGAAPPVARVPGSPPTWEGAAALRGEIYPVLDLERHLDIGPRSWTARVIAILEAGIVYGVLCSDPPYLLSVPRRAIRPPLEDDRPAVGLVEGPSGELVTVLDADALIDDVDEVGEKG